MSKLTPHQQAEAELEALKLEHELGVSNESFIPIDPHPKQKMFLDLNDKEALFGGATGGGKTAALLADALKYVDVPNYSALLLRRNFPDLVQEGGLISLSQEWLRPTSAKWHEQKKEWTFPSGARLRFGYLDTENDKFRYQGGEYQYIGFDELTQFSYTQYKYMFSRLRKREGINVPLRIRGATNPGGVGGQWVYDRFIPEDFSPNQADELKVWEKDQENNVKTLFVPSMLRDNPSLDQESYLESLMELDEVTREQYLKGDWLIQVRGDILYTYSEIHSVISWSQFASVFGERQIPKHWRVSVYQDFGTTEGHPCVTSWFATAGQNAPEVNGISIADKVFLYRGMMLTQATARDTAARIKQVMGDEVSQCHKWQMSHEAASERIEYNQQGLPFTAWPTGRTRGVEQLKNAFAVADKDKEHPFKRGVYGCPQLLLIVDDSELASPRTDAGLARWRAENVAYHWNVPKSGETPTQLVPYPLFNDACFVAGTLITTQRGDVPIEDVTNKDWILTRDGYKKTSGSYITNTNAQVKTYNFSDGNGLTATANHPIYVNNSFIPIDTLRVASTIEVWKNYNQECMQKSSHLTAQTSTDTPYQKAGRRHITSTLNTTMRSRERKHCTLRFGSFITEIFQKATISITRILTTLTMTLRTLSAYPPLTIENAIKADPQAIRLSPTWRESDPLRLSGIKARRGVNGIRRMERRRGTIESQLNESALNVKASMKHCLRMLSSVPRNANPASDINVKAVQKNGDNARFARNSSIPVNTPTQSAVQIRVDSVSDPYKAKVYNLTVADSPEYYANGILVHNCDTERAAAADYFPHSTHLTLNEQIHREVDKRIPPEKLDKAQDDREKAWLNTNRALKAVEIRDKLRKPKISRPAYMDL